MHEQLKKLFEEYFYDTSIGFHSIIVASQSFRL